MHYINQNDYPHIPYPHPEGIYTDMEPTIATSGCALCCLCMVVGLLTEHTLTLEDAIRLSMESGANSTKGTRGKVLLPYAAPKFGLQCEFTPDPEPFLAHLKQGKVAIVRAAGDTEAGVGLFSHSPHSIVAYRLKGDEVCILDPDLRPGKFDEDGRQGKVRTEGNLAYCHIDDLIRDSAGRSTSYALISAL